MKTAFDLDGIIYDLLRNSPVSAAITGGIYVRRNRPDDSDKEDIVINNTSLTQDSYPQNGSSNVNIYVKDENRNIFSKEQMKENGDRLEELTLMVLDTLMNARIDNVGINVENHAIIQEASANQHFSNIRIGCVLALI